MRAPAGKKGRWGASRDGYPCPCAHERVRVVAGVVAHGAATLGVAIAAAEIALRIAPRAKLALVDAS